MTLMSTRLANLEKRLQLQSQEVIEKVSVVFEKPILLYSIYSSDYREQLELIFCFVMCQDKKIRILEEKVKLLQKARGK